MSGRLTAKSANVANFLDKPIELATQRQIEIIEQKITAHTKVWGTNHIEISLETMFMLGGGITKAESQRIIYHRIIEEMEDRGFKVKIQLNTHSTILHVIWKVGTKDKEAAEIQANIDAKQIWSEDVSHWVNTSYN